MLDIKNLKDLENLFKVCRKNGIDAFEVGSIKFNMGTEPQKAKRYKPVSEDKANPIDPLAPGGISDRMQVPLPNIPRYEPEIPSDALTQDQLIDWSASSEQ